MEFFGIGTLEILLILVVALIIWGPRRLPEIGRTLGKITRSLKKVSLDFTTAVTKEIEQENSTPPKGTDNSKTEELPSATSKTDRHQDDQSKKSGEAPPIK